MRKALFTEHQNIAVLKSVKGRARVLYISFLMRSCFSELENDSTTVFNTKASESTPARVSLIRDRDELHTQHQSCHFYLVV